MGRSDGDRPAAGRTSTRTYFAWRNARSRCTNPRSAAWDNYGGRGITICARWAESYDAFVEDMGECPAELTLDRIDNSLGYFKENCRWVAWEVQHRNQRRTIRLADGTPMIERCEELGISYTRAAKRVNTYGRTPEQALYPDKFTTLKEIKHGTRSGYEISGCRCADCRAANARRHLAYMRSRSK